MGKVPGCFFLAAVGLAPGWAVPAPECGAQAVFQLEGDGVRTDRVRLWCQNTGKSRLRVEVPQGTVFAHPQLQDLVVLESRQLVVPPNSRVQCSLHTMCVGQRSEKPPSRPEQYTPAPCQSHPQATTALRLLHCAEKLCQNGDLPPLPILRGAQPAIVAQFAFWREQGMTREELKALVYAHTKPEPEKQPEADKGVDNLWEAVDLTQKEAKKS